MGNPTQQAFSRPIGYEIVSERMECCSPTSFFHTIEFEKTCSKMGTPTQQALLAPSVMKKLLKGWIPGVWAPGSDPPVERMVPGS